VRAFAVLVALVALVAAGCGSETDEMVAPPAEQTQTVTATEETSTRPAAPAIAGESLDGEPLALADYRGRPVLVNVWSSW
jgi:cytochrome oxidase Cu insertion factor (SCO1/SenC/PrrC family)